MLALADSTVLVTGASRGIGLAAAQAFAARGARVGLVAGSVERLADAAARIDGPTHLVAADLTDPAQCARAVGEVQAALGPVDVLVSCAGVLARDFVEDVSPEDFERAFRLHVGAALWLAQGVLPGMRARRRGAIVLVASELAIIGVPTYASYCTSKAGMLALADVLRHELVGSGVRVCSVCPGDVATDQLRGEQGWGPTGGVDYDAALPPERVARTIVRAAAGRRTLRIADRPHMGLAFTLMAGPRGMRFWPVHSAFRSLLRERAPRTGETPPPTGAATGAATDQSRSRPARS